MSNELGQWLSKVWDLVINHTIEKVDAVLDIGEVKLYWAGSIIRIDIKPK